MNRIGMNTTVSVGTTSIQIVPQNPPRSSLILRNRGTASLYLGFGMAASADDFEIGAGEDFQTSTTQAIYAIAASGTVLVKVLEEVRS